MSNGAETRTRRSRQKILTAAEGVFLQAGFLGASMDQVAQEAGVSKQTVYAHFKSKQALFIEVVVAMTGTASQALQEDSDAPPDDQPVRDFLLHAAREQLKVVLTPRLMHLRRMVIGEVERFPELGAALFANGPEKSIRRLARACAHFTATGQLQTPDPLTAATYFNWIVMGGPTSAAMLLGSAGIPDAAAREKHAAESVRIFLCAYGPQSSAAIG